MSFAPDRGDFVWLEFDPQAGREQRGHRPAIVISPRDYNAKIGLALVCPVTSKVKGYPFEAKVPPGHKVTGVVLADQVKSVDWRARRAAPIEKAPAALVDEVLAKAVTLLE